MLASNSPLKNDFLVLLKSAIKSISPAELINKNVKLIPKNGKDYLSIPKELAFKNQELINRQDTLLDENVYILAFGKAALGMTKAIEDLIGKKHLMKGIAIIPYNDAKEFIEDQNDDRKMLPNQIWPFNKDSKVSFFYGAENNLPDMNSCNATLKAYEMFQNLKETDILLTLISGGGSALLSLPSDITLTKNDVDQKNLQVKLDTIKKLINSGANINELNTVRSCLSRIKAGKLCQIAKQSQVISLVISDVIDDPLEIIASGPTCVSLINSAKNHLAMEVIHKYDLSNKIPKEAVHFLEQEDTHTENVQNRKVENYLIGCNKMATQAILDEISIQNMNYNMKLNLSNSVNGEAKNIGIIFAYIAFLLLKLKSKLADTNVSNDEIMQTCMKNILNSSLSQQENNILEKFLTKIINNDSFRSNFQINNNSGIKTKLCLITGGETTVTGGEINLMSCKTSKGGRCQEMTLSFENTIKTLSSKADDSYSLLFSSFGSDGIDGPTDAAGAFYLKESTEELQANYEEMNEFLSRHDSYNYFSKNNRLIKIGPTGTNVSDIQILLIEF